MDEKSPSQFSPKDACFRHIVGLKFALAGDMESAVSLETLLLRWNAIDWNNPAFIKLSEEMRAGLPKLTPEEEAGLDPSTSAILFTQNERLAEARETTASYIQAAYAVLELQERMKRFLDTYEKMRDRLQMLGVDMFEFQPPDI